MYIHINQQFTRNQKLFYKRVGPSCNIFTVSSEMVHSNRGPHSVRNFVGYIVCDKCIQHACPHYYFISLSIWSGFAIGKKARYNDVLINVFMIVVYNKSIECRGKKEK